MSLWIRDLEHRAADRLDPATRDFIWGGAGRELTATRNAVAWSGLSLVPHALRDVSRVSAATTVLGTSVSAPLLVSPMGCHALVHDGAEAEMARGVNAAQSVIGVPERGSTKLEDVITWAPGRAWFQIYLQQDRSYSLELVDRAIDAGYSAIVLTVDATARADRHRDRANNFSSAHLQRGNIPDGEDERFSAGLNASITLRDVELLSSRAGSTPVIVKGILRSDDARACVDAGARGIIVSNHGGRQLESAIPTAHVLRNVATAVGADAEVFVDGGIRSAEDIVKAVALGARAAMIGRPALWALATEGADGVARLLGDLRDDVTTTMALCGAADVAGLTSDMVA